MRTHRVAGPADAFDPRLYVSGSEFGALRPVDLEPSYLRAFPVQQDELGGEESAGAGREAAVEGLAELPPGFGVSSHGAHGNLPIRPEGGGVSGLERTGYAKDGRGLDGA